MRSIFILLILANIALFLYGLYSKQNSSLLSVPPENPGSASLVLLSEADQGGRPDEEHKSYDNASILLAPDGRGEACSVIGPFSSDITAEQFRQRLGVANISSRVDTARVKKKTGYWVYMPSFANGVDVAQVFKRLQSEGVDSYVITEGELANGLSLGLFSQQIHAEKLKDKLKARGYDVAVKQVERASEEFWVHLNAQQSERLGAELWQELHRQFAFTKRYSRSCENVALSSEIR